MPREGGTPILGKRKDGGPVDEEDRRSSTDTPVHSIHKRPRRGGNGSTANLMEQMQKCHEIVETLRNHKTEDGRLLAENFLRAPSRRISPEYHKLVTNPMDLMRIQQKLKNEEYETAEQFIGDVRNLTENAKLFYKKTTQEYKDAVDLWHLFLELKGRLLPETDEISEASGARSRESSPAQSTRSLRSNSPGRSTRSKETSPGRMSVSGNDALDKSYMEEYLAALLSVNDEKGRNITLAFRVLPSKEEYPAYYNVITNPMDLKTIAEKLRKGQYKNLNDIQRDLNMICRNAKMFNEPKSNIYKDANALKKILDTKKAEILELASQPLDKARALHASSVITELIQSPTCAVQSMEEDEAADEYEEDAEEEEVKMSNTRIGHFWRVYWAVRNARNGGDGAAAPLSEPFCRLPSKEAYPDYYDEIKNPVSLFMINRKIKRGEYERFVEVIDDMNLMFNNAKFYNVEGSPIFVAACKLQTITNQTAVEIDPTIDVSQYHIEIPSDTYGAEGEDESDASAGPSRGKKPKSRVSKASMDDLMSKYRAKLTAAYNAIVDHKDQSGRWMAEAFMEKPPRKFYPDYYQVIPDPIDFKTIKASIDGDKYDNLKELIEDVELLFNNARHYNEENSQIYNDANTLEVIFKRIVEKLGDRGMDSPKFLKEKLLGKSKAVSAATLRPRSSGSGSDFLRSSMSPSTMPKTPSKRTSMDVVMRSKMWTLYEAIETFKDARGNLLSPIFSKLPSKTDYPDYFEIIKKPIDMQKIHARLTQKQYTYFDELVQDFTLMLDNACKYNDPESAIYKSSLTLQRLLLQKKAELQDDEMDGKVPDVQTAVQELLTTLFIAVYNHEDEEGRCFSDSLAELPDLIKDAEPNAPVLSLDDIKNKLDKGRYRRLDRFQDDVFEVFKKARQLSRSDSQLFEDATELQHYFVRTRDELCKNGRGFMSPALKFTNDDVKRIVDEQGKQKQPDEKKEDAVKTAAEDDDPRLSPSKRKEGDTELQSVTINETTYQKGDFVYVKPNDEKKTERHILRVERLWRDGTLRQEFVSGNWYYRPHETYHLAKRKFLEKEVFRTEFYDSVDAQRLAGKCYVMFIKDYFKYRPEEFKDEDIYVCESKYMGKIRHFNKFKHWHIDMDAEKVTFVERVKPISATRVPSVFAAGVGDDHQMDDQDDDEEDYSILERKQEEIPIESSEAISGIKSYKKLHHESLWLKIGDGAYVESDGGGRKPEVIRIESMWRTPEGEGFVKGNFFVRPRDLVAVDPAHQYYRQELFATERYEAISLSRVGGKCVVLSVDDYSTLRPTEIREHDVFVSEWIVRPPPNVDQPPSESPTFLQFPMPKLSMSPMLDDEYYQFKKPLKLEKESLQTILNREKEIERLDSSTLSEVVAEIDTSDWSFLKSLGNTPKLGARSKSGYILFSAVVRKKIMHDNPEVGFGEISKLVGLEWKKLSDGDKKRYEEEATRIALEREKADKAAGGKLALPPGQIRVYCCKWKDCDYQFETSDQLYDHITTAHTSQIVDGDNQYVCLWLTCAKYRKDGKPFPSMPRLHRHIKDKHLPTSSKVIQPQNKSKHYVPLVSTTSPQLSPNSGGDGQSQQAPASAVSTVPMSAVAPSTVQPQVVYYQQPGGQSAPAHVLVDAQGNVLPGQQVVIYQVQQPPGQGIQPTTIQLPPNQQQQQQVPPNVIAPNQHQPPQLQYQQPMMQGDPGQVIVRAPQRPAEPVFVAPPRQRVQRVAHSDVYLRYIEGLATQQPTQSRWDRSLNPNVRLPPPASISTRSLPVHMFRQLPETKEELTQALANLRQHIMRDTLGIQRVLDSTSPFL